jgi:hypothetical protein
MAMADAFIFYDGYSKRNMFCFPNMDFSGDSYVSLFSNYAAAHAELIKQPAAVTMFLALKEGFPCFHP